MQTYLPELPFIGYGNVELNQGLHTGVKTAPRPYPRTDLNDLIPWTSFPDDIHNAIQDAMARSNLDGTTALTINPLTRSTVVANEEMIRAHATYALHAPVKDVVCRLGVEGDFTNSGAGNAAIIGSPDFSWVMDHAHPHPKLIVCLSPHRTRLHILTKCCLCRSNISPGGWPTWKISLPPIMR